MSTHRQRAGLVVLGTAVGLFSTFGLRGAQGGTLLSSLRAPANTTVPTGSVPSSGHGTGTAPVTTKPVPNSGTATGAQINYYFGTMSVQVVISGGKITSVTTPSLNDGGNPRSVQIDQYALPILTQEVLSAQSGNIQSVSGASYTSAGFTQSLQSALGKLGR